MVMIYLESMQKEKLRNLRKSRYDIDMFARNGILYIKKYKPHKKFNYDYLIRFLNHEFLHITLRNRFDLDMSLLLDNLEGTGKGWKVN